MSTSITFHKHADRSGGPSEDGTYPLDRVTLIGKAPEQHEFSEGQVTRALSEGWASLNKGYLVFHLADGDLSYKITSGPDDPNEDGTRSGTYAAEAETAQTSKKESE